MMSQRQTMASGSTGPTPAAGTSANCDTGMTSSSSRRRQAAVRASASMRLQLSELQPDSADCEPPAPSSSSKAARSHRPYLAGHPYARRGKRAAQANSEESEHAGDVLEVAAIADLAGSTSSQQREWTSLSPDSSDPSRRSAGGDTLPADMDSQFLSGSNSSRQPAHSYSQGHHHRYQAYNRSHLLPLAGHGASPIQSPGMTPSGSTESSSSNTTASEHQQHAFSYSPDFYHHHQQHQHYTGAISDHLPPAGIQARSKTTHTLLQPAPRHVISPATTAAMGHAAYKLPPIVPGHMVQSTSQLGNTSPSDSEQRWSREDERALILVLNEVDGRSWADIARRAFPRHEPPKYSPSECHEKWKVISKDKKLLNRGPWTQDEDAALVDAIQLLKPEKWVVIATQVAYRNGKQCRERWHNHLDPASKLIHALSY